MTWLTSFRLVLLVFFSLMFGYVVTSSSLISGCGSHYELAKVLWKYSVRTCPRLWVIWRTCQASREFHPRVSGAKWKIPPVFLSRSISWVSSFRLEICWWSICCSLDKQCAMGCRGYHGSSWSKGNRIVCSSNSNTLSRVPLSFLYFEICASAWLVQNHYAPSIWVFSSICFWRVLLSVLNLVHLT